MLKLLVALYKRLWKPEGLSRADFAFDFLLLKVDFDGDSFVTAATKGSQHRKDDKVQTFTFGRDKVVLRVYSKPDEIKEASGKFLVTGPCGHSFAPKFHMFYTGAHYEWISFKAG